MVKTHAVPNADSIEGMLTREGESIEWTGHADEIRSEEIR